MKAVCLDGSERTIAPLTPIVGIGFRSVTLESDDVVDGLAEWLDRSVLPRLWMPPTVIGGIVHVPSRTHHADEPGVFQPGELKAITLPIDYDLSPVPKGLQ